MKDTVLNQENIIFKLITFLSLMPEENMYKLCDKVKEEVLEMAPWERC